MVYSIPAEWFSSYWVNLVADLVHFFLSLRFPEMKLLVDPLSMRALTEMEMSEAVKQTMKVSGNNLELILFTLDMGDE